MNLLLFFWLLLKASLFSTNGMGNVPMLHNDLLTRGWATEKEFGQALVVGQVAPGPNGLWVISLSYFVAGWRGSLLALIAICLPPLLVLGISKLYQQVRYHPRIEGFLMGLTLGAVGSFLVVLLRVLAGSGVNALSLLILTASMVLGAWRRVPLIAILSLSGVAGYLFG